MRGLLLVLMTYAAFVLQTSVVPLVDWGAFTPQVVVAGLVLVAWSSSTRAGLLTAIGWGIVSDGLSQGPLGIDMVLFALAAWTVQIVRSRRPPDSALAPAALAGLTVLMVQIVSTGIRAVVEKHFIEAHSLIACGAGPAFSSALLVAMLVLIWRLAGQTFGTGALSARAGSARSHARTC